MRVDETLKPTCAILDDYQGVALTSADWSSIERDYSIRVLRGFGGEPHGEDEVVRQLTGCKVIIAMRERTAFPRRVLERLDGLKLLITTGMANASIDIDGARSLGITVCGTASSPTPPTELTWALILGLARQIVPENCRVQAGAWQQSVGDDLSGRTLGLLGLGKIGTRVARVAQAFDMHVVAWSQNLDAEVAKSMRVQRAESLEDLAAASDFLSIHVRLSERTRLMIGSRQLALMKPTAFLINTARAEIVDTDALIDAVSQGRIAGAGLDVYDEEPLAPNSPLRRLPGILSTPHLGYVTKENYERFYTQAVEDIVAFDRDAPVRVLS